MCSSDLDAIGYFDEESPVISEEVDLHYRAIRAGYVVWLDSTLAIPYRPRGNLLGQLQLYFRYGGAKSAFITKYRTLITLRQLIAPGFYLALLALLVSALLWPSLWGLFGLALGAYVAALLSCGLLECGRRRQIQLAPLVAVVSAAMHVG